MRALPAGRLLLAVSGGRDSMVLLHAASAARKRDIVVATFDHGTGPAAMRAAELVERVADRLGLPCITGAGKPGGGSEDVLRRARWEFLNRWAGEAGAPVVTAHSRDDQIETVVIRILRDAGARGLAAMYAPSPVVRPLLGISRGEIEAYAAAAKVTWVEDPSNAGLRFLRNRVRHELLPAIERVQPGFGDRLLALSQRAAKWRAELDVVVDSLLGVAAGTQVAGVVPAAALTGLSAAGAAVVWTELAGRAGVALDWRGVERLVAQAANLKPGSEIPLSGGIRVRRTVSSYLIGDGTGPSPLY